MTAFGSRQKFEDGSISLTVLVILPFLVGCAVVLVAIFIVLKSHSQTQHMCRKGLLRAEQQRLDGMHRLMALNVRAQILRAKRQTAEAVLAAALVSNPAAVPAARAKLLLVHNQQLVLSTKQKSLIFSINAKTRSQILALRSSLQSSVARSVRYLGGGSGTAFGWSAAERRPLAVDAQPASSLTPDYFPAQRFSRLQLMRLQWQIQPLELLPRWMKSGWWGLTWLDSEGTAGVSRGAVSHGAGSNSAASSISLKLKGQCTTTAEQEERSEKWRARLEADKPLSS